MFRIAAKSDRQRTTAFDDFAPVGGAPSGSTWVKRINRTGNVVGIVVDAHEDDDPDKSVVRSDVFIGADNTNVRVVLALVEKARTTPQTEHVESVGALEYVASATTANAVTVVAHMTQFGKRVRGPWDVFPVAVSAW
ncbi:MAG: hypothetical protein CMI16_13050 [Opitutaceae bacterium]|nr:hypothetical protein [Opitutaceae bacterium]|tara:strand:- start:105 stop:515 length:411 start_codon:yes stop_codon:yes gene_type:complete